ncbi:MAG: hypothetical protein Q7S97_13145 [Polaromonas sp.]|nr:hypothetical protein [Polaromonas sp.]
MPHTKAMGEGLFELRLKAGEGIARVESPTSSHSPSGGTLQKYARALGFKVEIRLVPDAGPTGHSNEHARSRTRRST